MPFDLTFRTPITIPSDIPEKDQWGGPHQGGHEGDWTQAEGNDFRRGKGSPDTDRVRAFYTQINKLEKGIAPGAVLKRGDPTGKIRSSSGAGVHLHFAMVERVRATWDKPRGIEIPGDFRKWALEASPANHVIRLFGDGTTDPVLDPTPPAPAQPQGGADSTPVTGGSNPLSTPAANPDAGCNDAAVPQAVTSQADDGTTLDGGVIAVQRLSRTVAPAGCCSCSSRSGIVRWRRCSKPRRTDARVPPSGWRRRGSCRLGARRIDDRASWSRIREAGHP